MKQIIYKFLLVFVVAFFFVGCNSTDEKKDTTAPVFITPTEISVYENADFVVKLKVDDESPLHYSLAGEDSALFEIGESTGIIVCKEKFDYETLKHQFELNVTVRDSSHSVSQPLTINLLNENDNMPFFTMSLNVFVDENQLDAVELKASDNDNDTLHYSISTLDSDFFIIDENNGSVRFKVPANYEEKHLYSFLATASDGEFNTTKLLTLNIKNINEMAPNFITPLTFEVDSYDDNAVVKVQADDGDNNLNDVNYFLIGGADKDKCNIDLLSGKIIFKVQPNYNVQSSYTLEVMASDGQFDTNQTIVVNVKERTGLLNDTVINVEENQQSVVTLVHDDTFTNGVSYGIYGGDEFDFSLNNSTGEIVFNNAPDYETKNVYYFTASVTDGVKTLETNMTINIINLNDNEPYFTSENNISMTENTKEVTTLKATDRDGDSLTFTLSGEDSAEFDLNATTGVLTLKSPSDFETKSFYSLVSSVTDGNFSQSLNLYIEVQDYQHIFQTASFQSKDFYTNDLFAKSVAISGNYIVVGSDSEDVYLFQKDANSITQVAKIRSSDLSDGDKFGLNVSIDGDYILIGASQVEESGDKYGAAYLFKKENNATLTQLAKITADDGAVDDEFGYEVKIAGDYLVIGSPNSENKGAVYIYKRESDSNITKLVKLLASDNADGDRFGQDVDIYGDYIVVGAASKDSNSGKAYLFFRESDDNISETVAFSASDVEEGDNFGSALALYENKMLVGAYGKNSSQGSVYLFKIGEDHNVTEFQQLQAQNSMEGLFFGAKIDMYQNYIAISGIGDSTIAEMNGALYVFHIENNESAVEINKYFADTINIQDTFGSSIALEKENLIVGAYQNKAVGSAYLFNLEAEQKPYVYNFLDAENSFDESINGVDIVDIRVKSSSTLMTTLLSGEDASLLSIDENQTLSFNDGVDFENPSDIDANNDYNLTLSFSDEIGTKVLQRSIKVQNKIYPLLSENLGDSVNALDYFGTSVSVSGDYVVVGSKGDDSSASDAGAVYLFKKDATSLTQIAKIVSQNIESNDAFGTSVDIDGDYIVVGAVDEDEVSDDAGAVYLFKRNSDTNITQIAKLIADNGGSYDDFGTSVAIDGDYIIVGSPMYTGTDQGGVYLFKRNSDDTNDTAQIAFFQPEDIADYDQFATSVDISGDYMIVGSPSDDDNGTSSGSAYVLIRNSDQDDDISQLEKITADDAQEADNFGKSVAIDGDYMVVGAYNKTVNNVLSVGKAYLFKHNSDTDIAQIATLNAQDTDRKNLFGTSVSMSGNFIVIGASSHSKNLLEEGGAYLFERTSDSETVFIESYHDVESELAENFGTSVCIDGSSIVVGASNKSHLSDSKTGTTFVYLKD